MDPYSVQVTLILSKAAALFDAVPLMWSRNSVMVPPAAVTVLLKVPQLVDEVLTMIVESPRSVPPLRLYRTDAVAEPEFVL